MRSPKPSDLIVNISFLPSPPSTLTLSLPLFAPAQYHMPYRKS
jgi:hypothetical protein